MLKSRRDRKYLKEELLEVVGHMADDVDDQGWQEGGQDDAQQPPLDRHLVVNIAEKVKRRMWKLGCFEKIIEVHLNSYTPLLQPLHHPDFLDGELKEINWRIIFL